MAPSLRNQHRLTCAGPVVTAWLRPAAATAPGCPAPASLAAAPSWAVPPRPGPAGGCCWAPASRCPQLCPSAQPCRPHSLLPCPPAAPAPVGPSAAAPQPPLVLLPPLVLHLPLLLAQVLLTPQQPLAPRRAWRGGGSTAAPWRQRPAAGAYTRRSAHPQQSIEVR